MRRCSPSSMPIVMSSARSRTSTPDGTRSPCGARRMRAVTGVTRASRQIRRWKTVALRNIEARVVARRTGAVWHSESAQLAMNHDTTTRDAHRRTIALAIVVALGGFLFRTRRLGYFRRSRLHHARVQPERMAGWPGRGRTNAGGHLLLDRQRPAQRPGGPQASADRAGIAVHDFLDGGRHRAQLRSPGGRALCRRSRLCVARHCADVHRGNRARGKARPDGVFQPVQHHGRLFRRLLRQLLSAEGEPGRSSLGASAGHRSSRLALDAGIERPARGGLAIAPAPHSGKPTLADRQRAHQ